MLATSDATIFGLVVFLVVAVGVVVAVGTGLRGRDAYERIGGAGPVPERPPGADAAERDEEIRQLEQARRRRRELRAAAGVPDRAPGPAPAAGAPERAPGRAPAAGVPDRAPGPAPAAGAPDRAPGPAPAAGAPDRAPGRAPAAGDPELAEELRQLAQARNVRRARAGLEPLDVEAEVARRMPDG